MNGSDMNGSDMNEIDPTTTLADLVTARPALAAPLERWGLDYCCGGGRPLAAAVDTAGLDLDVVLATLGEAASRDFDGDCDDAWGTLGPAALVDHLEATHHAYLREALPRLDALAAKVLSAHGARHPELADVHRLLADLRADLEPHLLKEERVLFPMIRELAQADTPPAFHCGSLANPIGMMGAEHDTAGALLARLREVTDTYAVPADGCASYRAFYDGLAELESDLHLHVHKENNVLFPAVLRAEAALQGAQP